LEPQESIGYERDADGVVTLTWDLPGRPVNVLGEASIAAFAAGVERVIRDDAAVGAIVASAKRDWIVGADLAGFLNRNDDAILASIDGFHRMTRAMETGGKPFVAALNGSALGGGAEIALAAHRRIAAAAPQARFGSPEVTLGLIPAGGGTQRMPRRIGIAASLPLLLEGKTLRFEQAREAGLIDEIVPAAELHAAAKAWLLAHRDAQQPWDGKGFRFPGGAPESAQVVELFTGASAMLRKKTWGNYPATRAILSAVFEGTLLPIDAALRVEARYFRSVLARPEARAMIRTLFFAMNDAKKLTSRPANVPRATFRTVAVLGAGMMGAAIAYVTARSGARVILIDRTMELAERGKAHSATLLAQRRATSSAAADDAATVLARIEAGTDFAALADADLVIEAVFEDRGIKADVTRRAETVLPAHAIFGSNTSTLPITGLAEASALPERFIGVHFFSPVEKMMLVEIIRGKATSDETLARALDYVRSIGKTPIVVNDRRGFFTSRVFAAYVNEGLAMLAEGVAPALIENGGRMAGMAVGPLAVADEVSFTLMQHVMRQTRADLGNAHVPGCADDVIDLFATTLDRPGKKAGRGVYDYPSDARKALWSGLAERFPIAAEQPDVETVKLRLLIAQTIEAQRAFDEGVLEDTAMGDVGSILGWGFPPFTGGVFSYADYLGSDVFETQRALLAQRYGPRFERQSAARELSAAQ